MAAVRFRVLFIVLSLILLPFQNCGKLAPVSTTSKSSISIGESTPVTENSEQGQEDQVFEPDPEAPLNIAALDSELIENRNAKISVRINKVLENDLTFSWETRPDTADSYLNVEQQQGQGIILAGQTEAQISVPVIQSAEDQISFFLKILTTSQGEISRDEAKVNIPVGSVPFQFLGQVSPYGFVASDFGFNHNQLDFAGGVAISVGGATDFTSSPVPGVTDTNSTYLFNPATRLWQLANVNGAPTSRIRHTVTTVGSKIFVFGGYTDGERSDHSVYDPALDAWTAVNSSGSLTPRSYHSTVRISEDRVLVFGGLPDLGAAAASDGAIYDIEDGIWIPIANAPGPRRGHAAFWDEQGQRMFVFGGSERLNQEGLALVDVYNLANNTWERLSPTNIDLFDPPGFGAFESAFHIDGEVFLPNSGSKYVIAQNTFVAIAKPFFWSHCIEVHGEIFCINSAGLRNLYRYDPIANQWTVSGAINDIGSAFPRLVFTGREILITGGSSTTNQWQIFR